MKLLLVLFQISFLSCCSHGQMGSGNSRTTVQANNEVERMDCGFRHPYAGTATLSTSVGFSHYRDLGQGMINRTSLKSVTFDIGCIDLDDPARRKNKDELLQSLIPMTKGYLRGAAMYSHLRIPTSSFELRVVPTKAMEGREMFEFESESYPHRRVRFSLSGNRVSIFLAETGESGGIDQALELFDAVEYFSVREAVLAQMNAVPSKLLPEFPDKKAPLTDAEHRNLRGQVKSVMRESVDEPVLVGSGVRRIREYAAFDMAGNETMSFWFQEAGYPTSVTFYGYVDGATVSVSQDIGRSEGIIAVPSARPPEKLSHPDTRFQNRYEYSYDTSQRPTEMRIFDNRGRLERVHKFIYSTDSIEEKRMSTEGELVSTRRFKLDSNGNVLRYEFWWYEQTDKETESYEYEKSDGFGNWTERRVVRTIIDRGMIRKRTFNEYREITYHRHQPG